MQKLLPVLLAIFLLTACAQSSLETKMGEIEKKETTKIELELPEATVCKSLAEFENEPWFEILAKKYISTQSNQIFGVDKFFCEESGMGCLLPAEKLFIFVPMRTKNGNIPIFAFDFEKQSLKKSSGSEFYLVLNFGKITDNYIEFSGGGSSGECGVENYGKYFFKENKVEIYRRLKWCGSTDGTGVIDRQYSYVNEIYAE